MFPLLGINSLVGVSVPVYDLYETVYADENKFYDDNSYVAIDNNEVKSSSDACIAFSVIFLVLGIGALVFYKLRSKTWEERREELMDSEVRQSEN